MENAQKKFLNSSDLYVDDNIKGYLAVHYGLHRLDSHRVILRHDIEQFKSTGKVCILTGGGSGHEPAFAGYVGEGMAAGAVLGAMFASPGPTSVSAAIRAVKSPNSGGIIMVFNNYTGDRLNFGLATERAKAEGIKIDIILNADDCAIIGKDKTAGRRGLAGLMFLLKIVGGMAEEGKCFEEIMTVGQTIADGIATLGVCTYPCSVPGSGLLFNIQPDEMVFGLGLHGEAGIETTKMKTAKETVAHIIKIMTDPENKCRIILHKGDNLAVLLNNLGSTSETEMNILAKEAIDQLETRGLNVERAYMGRYATSQEMTGFSISILVLSPSYRDYLDQPTTAPAWIKPYVLGGLLNRRDNVIKCSKGLSSPSNETQGAKLSEDDARTLKVAIEAACKAIIESCERLNQLDSACGDGDCGSTLSSGAQALLNDMVSVSSAQNIFQHPQSMCVKISEVLEMAMGGCSGALYSMLFTAASSHFAKSATLLQVRLALESAVSAIQTYGGAEKGDRTMLDSFLAAQETLSTHTDSFSRQELLRQIIVEVGRAAEATSTMEARAGRASYVSQQYQSQPDAGATAVAVWMKAALAKFIEKDA